MSSNLPTSQRTNNRRLFNYRSEATWLALVLLNTNTPSCRTAAKASRRMHHELQWHTSPTTKAGKHWWLPSHWRPAVGELRSPCSEHRAAQVAACKSHQSRTQQQWLRPLTLVPSSDNKALAQRATRSLLLGQMDSCKGPFVLKTAAARLTALRFGNQSYLRMTRLVESRCRG